MTTCMIPGCTEPPGPDSDECVTHLAQWERARGDAGYTESPCREGHYSCAHFDRGPCHADPDTICLRRNCREG